MEPTVRPDETTQPEPLLPLFPDEDPAEMPAIFEYGEIWEGAERRYGLETDVLTDGKHSDTD